MISLMIPAHPCNGIVTSYKGRDEISKGESTSKENYDLKEATPSYRFRCQDFHSTTVKG